MLKLITLIFTLLTFSCFSQGVKNELLNSYFNILEKNDKLMGAVSVNLSGNQIYSNAVGNASSNSEKTIKNTRNTRFRIGSITKTFTSTIIFQMIEEGKLTLDTKLSEYFPEISNASKISISNLLNHSSGLYNFTDTESYSKWSQKKTKPRKIFSIIKKHAVVFQPNERHEYSNSNYYILGQIIETLEGKSYAEVLQDRIATRLGLQNTYYGGKLDLKNNESYSYQYDKNWFSAPETDVSVPHAAGAIVSTSTDLTKFIQALFNGELITKENLSKMIATKGEYGSGIFKMDFKNTTVYYHSGNIDGFNSLLAYVPQFNMALSLVTNGLNVSMFEVASNVFMGSLGQPFELPNYGTIVLTAKEIQEYTGIYSSEKLPFKLQFEAEGNILKGAPHGSNLKELTPTKKHIFTLDRLGIVIDFDIENGTLNFTQGNEDAVLFTREKGD